MVEMSISPDHATSPTVPPVASSGVAGLDVILGGGFPREEMHLVQGVAGTGKTTMALQFLREGVRQGEPTLYVTLSQSQAHLERIAHSHGWLMDGITVLELSPGTVADRISSRQTVLPTVEVELGELFRELAEVVTRVAPRRAIVDSITILQLLSGSATRYHREVVTLRQLFAERGCTVLALADHPAETQAGDQPEVIFHPLSGCVVHLQQEGRPFGDARRRIRVVKARGMAHNGGYHDLKIFTGGMEVYPRLDAYSKPENREFPPLKSGIAMLDRLIGGGLELGTSCLLVGPSGVGKSSLATVYADAAARAGGKAAIFLLDERPETYIFRAEGLGIGLRAHVASGRVSLVQLDPAEITPGQFAQQVRKLVEEDGIKVVVIDSVVGYFAAMGSSSVLITQLHEVLTFLTRSGVLVILCGSQEGFMSIGSQDTVDVSYLSDTIVCLAYFEAAGDLRRGMAVVKKKHGGHATTIHEISVEDGRIFVGEEPLKKFGAIMVTERSSDRGDGHR
jgi:circadian clock protein KaiC